MTSCHLLVGNNAKCSKRKVKSFEFMWTRAKKKRIKYINLLKGPRQMFSQAVTISYY